MSNNHDIEVLSIEQRKRRALKKKFKKAVKYKVIGNNIHMRLMLKDIEYMYEDLIDLLLLDNFTNRQQYVEAINAYLSLECKAYDYKITLKYKIGSMFDIVKAILLHHESLQLQT